jgi:general stress protein 26
MPSMPNPVTETEVNNFLESKLNMQIATIDEEGYPMIQPTWFIYDKESGKVYTATQKLQRSFTIFEEILTRFTFLLMMIATHTSYGI